MSKSPDAHHNFECGYFHEFMRYERNIKYRNEMNKRVQSDHFFIFQRHHVEEIRPKSKKFFEKLKMKITLTEISKIHLKKLHTLLCQGQSWGKESVHIHGKHMKAQKRREKSKKKFLEICHIFLHYLNCKIYQSFLKKNS